jgi:hypothetical protein
MDNSVPDAEPLKAVTNGAEPAVIWVQFVEVVAPTDGSVIAEFAQPRRVFAVQTAVAGDGVSQVGIVRLPEGTLSNRGRADAWIAPSAAQDGVDAVNILFDGGRIRWRPDRAVIEAAPEAAPDAMSAVVEFAFLEGELRRLEQALQSYESGAAHDVKHAYGIRSEHGDQWGRLVNTMEGLAQLRLAFARLEPQLMKGRRALPARSRRLVTRLLAKSDAATRAEALSDRMEACEDLYEGAVDRITDFRWYRKGYWLEMAIVILLAAEVLLLLYDLYG